ncbi:MAG: hypothetical protein ABEI77_00465 [Halorientalis sp.]
MNAHSTSQEPTVTAPEQAEELRADDVFEVLGNRRRRYVFHHLKRNADRAVYLDELTDQVAAWEGDQSVTEISQRKYNSVRTALRQSHLPKMADRGFVDYDPDQQTVALAPAAAELDVYLDVVGRGDIPWSLYYLGLTVLFGALVVATFAGIAPVSTVSENTVAGFFVVTIGVSALVHTYVSYTEMKLGAGDDPPEVLQR